MTEMAVKYQNYYLGGFMFLFQRMLFLRGGFWNPLCSLLWACDNWGENVVAEHWYIFEVFSNISLSFGKSGRRKKHRKVWAYVLTPPGVLGSGWAEWWTVEESLGRFGPSLSCPKGSSPGGTWGAASKPAGNGSAVVSSGCHLQNSHCFRFDIESGISWFSPL